MAETYGIYDLRALPAVTTATLACGLRDSSRTKQHLIDVDIPLELQIQVGIFDVLRWIKWSKTKDAETGSNCPESLLAKLLGIDQPQTTETVTAFATADEFERRRIEILGGTDNADIR